MKASKRIGKRQGAWTNPQYKYKANPRWTTKITHLNSDIFRKWHGLADWGWHYIDTHDWSLYGHKGLHAFFFKSAVPTNFLAPSLLWYFPCTSSCLNRNNWRCQGMWGIWDILLRPWLTGARRVFSSRNFFVNGPMSSPEMKDPLEYAKVGLLVADPSKSIQKRWTYTWAKAI